MNANYVLHRPTHGITYTITILWLESYIYIHNLFLKAFEMKFYVNVMQTKYPFSKLCQIRFNWTFSFTKSTKVLWAIYVESFNAKHNLRVIKIFAYYL